jgi:hypothetical protein
MIPFEDNGNIQPGIHYFTYEMFKKQFVDDFTSSYSRKEIHHLSFLWLAEVERVVTPLEVWFNGDFTSTKENPKEIELCVYLLRSNLNDSVVSDCLKLVKSALANYKCKPYFGIIDPIDNSLSSIGPYYWTEQFGFDSFNIPKGIVVLPWEEISTALK